MQGLYFSLPYLPGVGVKNSLYNFPLNLIKLKIYYYDSLFTPFLRYGLNIEYTLNIDIVYVLDSLSDMHAYQLSNASSMVKIWRKLKLFSENI